MWRSMMESIAFEYLYWTNILRDENIAVNKMIGTGGGSKSRIWNQIKADVTGKPLRVFDFQEFSALGAAMLAGTASGVYRSFGDAVSRTRWLRAAGVIEPDPASRAAYERAYQRYAGLYPAMRTAR